MSMCVWACGWGMSVGVMINIDNNQSDDRIPHFAIPHYGQTHYATPTNQQHLQHNAICVNAFPSTV